MVKGGILLRHAKNMIFTPIRFLQSEESRFFCFGWARLLQGPVGPVGRMGHVLVHGPQHPTTGVFWTLPSNDHRVKSICSLQCGFNFHRQAQQRLSTSTCFNCKKKSLRIARMIHADRIPKRFHPNGISIAFFIIYAAWVTSTNYRYPLVNVYISMEHHHFIAG